MVIYIVREDVWLWVWFSHPWRSVVDSFRVALPAARWHGDCRAWRVGSKHWPKLSKYAQNKGYRLVVIDRRQQIGMF